MAEQAAKEEFRHPEVNTCVFLFFVPISGPKAEVSLDACSICFICAVFGFFFQEMGVNLQKLENLLWLFL